MTSPWKLSAGKKIAAYLATAATLVVLGLRIWLTPQMRDWDTGLFHPSYGLILFMVVVMAALGFLAWGSPAQRVPVQGKLLLPTAVMGLLAGSVMVITSLWDAFMWWRYGETPPPNVQVISGIDGLTLLFTLVFGVLGGIFLVRLSLLWLSDNRSRSGVMQVWALAPVGWIWMRLARYEVSYASAVSVSESFYDFVMLVFLLLFLFAFARYVSGVGTGSPRLFLFFAAVAAMCCISGALTRVFLYMTGEGEASHVSELAGASDALLGIFALLLVFGQAYSSKPSAPPDTISEQPPAQERPSSAGTDA